jgi:hypothetical protein
MSEVKLHHDRIRDMPAACRVVSLELEACPLLLMRQTRHHLPLFSEREVSTLIGKQEKVGFGRFCGVES